MLRITDIRETTPDGAAVWTLKLEGNIEGQWVTELRHAWRAVRLSAGQASIRVVLADVQAVDTAGKVLLTEMHRDGVDILSTDSLTAAILAEVVDGASIAPAPPRSRA